MRKHKPKVKGAREKRVRVVPVIGAPKEERPAKEEKPKGFAIKGGVLVVELDEIPTWSRNAKPKKKGRKK
ncbi:MAG TPA: hypothetical protein VFE62_03565 [Gemmataceae bacterium]|nr:hypothetical protein [Gemmataceae bacterium]